MRLSGVEISSFAHDIDELTELLNDIDRNIRNCEDIIISKLLDKKSYEIRILGLKAAMEARKGEDSELVDYFICNKRLRLVYADNKRIRFVVTDYASYFDEEAAKTAIGNRQSAIYEEKGHRGGNISDDDIEKLMREIFIEQNIRLRFSACYEIRIGERVRGITGDDYGGIKYNDYMPNPHICEYSCLGNYEAEMNKAVARNDYVAAVELCVASCKSLNLVEYASMHEFILYLYDRKFPGHSKCLELPDGTITDYIGALNWLKERDRAEEPSGSQASEAIASEHLPQYTGDFDTSIPYEPF